MNLFVCYIRCNKNFQNTYIILVEPPPRKSTWDIPRHVLEEITLSKDSKRSLDRPSYNRKQETNVCTQSPSRKKNLNALMIYYNKDITTRKL